MKPKKNYLNPKGTYEVRTKSGEFVESYRTKDAAVNQIARLKKLYYEELIIVQVKGREYINI